VRHMVGGLQADTLGRGAGRCVHCAQVAMQCHAFTGELTTTPTSAP
jgi:hypothetical protein